TDNSVGSISSLKEKNKELLKQYESLGESQRNSAEGKRLIAEYNKNKAQIGKAYSAFGGEDSFAGARSINMAGNMLDMIGMFSPRTAQLASFIRVFGRMGKVG
ncbi:hypothetical protein RZS08_52500, partial [Arthrospira platensis SPKY1]|nr:hypothetical protein [Arthrospira platensis SPKY1]